MYAVCAAAGQEPGWEREEDGQRDSDGRCEKSVERADILLEALPYIRRFYGKTDRHQVRRPCDGG